ncbi:serine/threonine-protein kinase [Leptolyngbya sp. FACHB-8]|nr:serine/threonine-protein kinase [Leptolyngbya sp. FACHB-8]MBD2156077.1 GUN4 domain-containing protein [Leptolyngbya sp. FACHB-16]
MPFLLRGRYQCDRTLGQGGFGRTYLVNDTYRGNTIVVVKQFIPNTSLRKGGSNLEKALRLFEQESERLLQLDQHPQIPTLFEAFEANNSHYLVQQFIEGRTLADLLTRLGKPFDETQIRSVLLNLLPVLQFIHSQNIIHRDIKPENVIRRSSDKRLVLIDFGAAKAATITLMGETGTTIGSTGYAAPEQIYGKAVFASDLYSLGVMCLHLLTQVKPSELYDPMEGILIWRQFLGGRQISPGLAAVLDRMTQSLVKDRYPSAQHALRELLQHTKTTRQKAPSLVKATPAAQSLPNSVPAGRLVQAGRGERSPTFPAVQPKTPAFNVNQLASECGIDYQKLKELLEAGKWKEADWETNWRMLQAVGRKEDDFVRPKELQNFPCQDLSTIDGLWTHYSQGRFGFSVQRQIYLDCGGIPDGPPPTDHDHAVWQAFGDRVGWRQHGQWLEYSKLSPSLALPSGCFPLGFSWGGWPAGFACVGGMWATKLLHCWVFLFARIGRCSVR